MGEYVKLFFQKVGMEGVN